MVPHTGTISRMRPRATAEFVCTSVSLPGLTGQSSIHGRWLLDRPVKPGEDSRVSVSLFKKALRNLSTTDRLYGPTPCGAKSHSSVADLPIPAQDTRKVTATSANQGEA